MTSHLIQGCVGACLALGVFSWGVAGERPGAPTSTARSDPVFAVAPSATEKGGIRYLAGGVGADARDSMRRRAPDYSARLSFSAGRDDHYVPDVRVTVRDARNKVMLELPEAGPLVYIDLPPGSYAIEAEHAGTVRHREIRIGKEMPHRRAFFHFPDDA